MRFEFNLSSITYQASLSRICIYCFLTTRSRSTSSRRLAYRADAVINALLSLMWLGWELLSLNIIQQHRHAGRLGPG